MTDGSGYHDEMSPAAAAYLNALERRFRTEEATPPERWLFDEGVELEQHTELEQLGLIEKMLGTNKGFAWRLTEVGRETAFPPAAAG